MKVAFVGKGGAGKSALAGTLCRHLAQRGECVLALDLDTVAGLALSLGLGTGSARLPAGLAERVEGNGWQVKHGTRPARLVDRYAQIGPDGVGFLALGKLPGQVEPTVTVAFRYVLEGFRRRGWSMVADLAAGTRQPMFGWAGFARTVLVVADSSSKSTLTARRLIKAGVGTHLVANNYRIPAIWRRSKQLCPCRYSAGFRSTRASLTPSGRVVRPSMLRPPARLCGPSASWRRVCWRWQREGRHDR